MQSLRIGRRTLAFVACAALTLACGPKPLPPSAESAILGRDVPRFSRPSVGGEPAGTKDVEGKIVVVKFFAKFCEPCKKTLPEAQRLHESRSDVVVIGVAEDESERDVAELVSLYRLTFPVIHDRGNVLSGRYRVADLPSTFVANAAGKIVWVGGPAQAPGDLDSAVSWAAAKR